MDQRIPLHLQPIFEDYLSQVHLLAPDLISGFYIVGSIALGGYNDRYSDIDFVAVLSRKTGTADLEALKRIHQAVENSFPRSKLSGSYLQAGDLERFEPEVEPHPYFHDGVLRPAGHFELNGVTWWTLKNQGITLLGPDACSLPIHVDWDLLISKMRENLNSYWASWARRPGRMVLLLSDWGIQWAVTGVLRQFYTFQENGITTKDGAAQYALQCLSPRWRRITGEALDIRAGGRPSAYRSRIARAVDAVRFIRYIIQACNDGFEQCDEVDDDRSKK